MSLRSFRTALVVACTAALVAGPLAGSPAQAAGTVTIAAGNIAFTSSGSGEVYVKCTSSSTCKGDVFLEGTPKTALKYSVGAKKSAWVKVKVHPNHPGNPFSTTSPGTGSLSQRPVTLNIGGAKKSLVAEKRVTKAKLTGTVNGSGPTPTDVVVKLWSSSTNGTGTTFDRSVANAKGGQFSYDITVGRNNSSSASYRLEVTGKVDGQYRTWFWRGSNGASKGGGRYIRDASIIKVGKYGYTADVTYGSIRGSVVRDGQAISSDVTVAAPPPSFSGGSKVLRSLDIASCANIFATGRSTGSGYHLGFLPRDTTSADKRYMVLAEDNKNDTANLWNDTYGSCQDAMNYEYSRTNLIALSSTAPTATQSFTLREAPGRVAIDARYSSSPTTSDRHVALRQYVKGVKIADSKLLQTSIASSGGVRTFKNVAPGKYWVEVARRTNCSSWMPSRFANNRAYFQGIDRAAERWKTVAGTKAEYSKSIDNGFPRAGRKVPKGFKGHMYRNYCGSNGAGQYKLVDVSGSETESWKPSIRKGATISGRVTRTGGRTNKEMMVAVYSTGGVLVQRTAVTNGSGRFTIRGLASGNYRVVVNPDSWRGIGRTFSGAKTKKVTAGKSYSVGTLNFKS